MGVFFINSTTGLDEPCRIKLDGVTNSFLTSATAKLKVLIEIMINKHEKIFKHIYFLITWLNICVKIKLSNLFLFSFLNI